MESDSYKQWISSIFSGAAPTYGLGVCSYFDYFAKGLVALAEIKPDSHVLDIATGRGAILKRICPLLNSKGRAVGIDLSSEMIHLTSGSIQADLYVMDAEQLDFSDDSFDTIFCGFGIFFFPNAEKALQEFFRVLKPGGKLFLSTWQQDNGSAHVIMKEELATFGFSKIASEQFRSQEFILKTLSASNFKEVKISSDSKDHIYPSIDSWFQSLWSHGSRGYLEKLTIKQLAELKQKLTNRLTPALKSDGLHNLFKVFYTEARKLS